MDDRRSEYYRAVIEARLDQLGREDTRGADGRATVVLDQQSVGRLSRMDALQNQAMSKASHARRQTERRRLNLALRRIEEGEYGYCGDCGDALPFARLDLDPAATRCVSCARG